MKKVKKGLLVMLSIVSLVVLYIVIEFIILFKTKDIPYCNLTEFTTADYLIFCNISYNDSVYKIIVGNKYLHDIVKHDKSKILKYYNIYSFWINEIIKYNLSIKCNNQMFDIFRNKIIKEEYLEKHIKSKTIQSIITNNGKIPKKILGDDSNAIIYLLLKDGINCRSDCESGEITTIFEK